MVTTLYRQFSESALIRSVAFAPHAGGRTGRLRIRFTTGDVYEYGRAGVDAVASMLVDAGAPGGSIGSAFHRHVRGRYRACKLGRRAA